MRVKVAALVCVGAGVKLAGSVGGPLRGASVAVTIASATAVGICASVGSVSIDAVLGRHAAISSKKTNPNRSFKEFTLLRFSDCISLVHLYGV